MSRRGGRLEATATIGRNHTAAREADRHMGKWNWTRMDSTGLGCDETGKDRQDRQGREKTGKEIAT